MRKLEINLEGRIEHPTTSSLTALDKTKINLVPVGMPYLITFQNLEELELKITQNSPKNATAYAISSSEEITRTNFAAVQYYRTYLTGFLDGKF